MQMKVTNIKVPKIRRAIMRKTRCNKVELLKAIVANREKHVVEYEDSVKDYKTIALAAVDDAMLDLKLRIETLKAGKVLHLGSVSFNIRVPENHSEDYDRAIKMLEMSVDSTIEMDADEFRQYVMDDWDWKEQWTATYFSNKARATSLH